MLNFEGLLCNRNRLRAYPVAPWAEAAQAVARRSFPDGLQVPAQSLCDQAALQGRDLQRVVSPIASPETSGTEASQDDTGFDSSAARFVTQC